LFSLIKLIRLNGRFKLKRTIIQIITLINQKGSAGKNTLKIKSNITRNIFYLKARKKIRILRRITKNVI